jgi:methionyl-tRNA formyltransferase
LLDEKLAIACADGAVRVLQLQRAGKQPMSAEEYLRGTAVAAGLRVG